jgi:hypothetical protein
LEGEAGTEFVTGESGSGLFKTPFLSLRRGLFGGATWDIVFPRFLGECGTMDGGLDRLFTARSPKVFRGDGATFSLATFSLCTEVEYRREDGDVKAGGGGVREGDRRLKSIGGANLLVGETRLEAVPGLELLLAFVPLLLDSIELVTGVTGLRASELAIRGVTSAVDRGCKSDRELLRFFFGISPFRAARSSTAEAWDEALL